MAFVPKKEQRVLIANFAISHKNKKEVNPIIFFDSDSIDHALLLEKLCRVGVRGLANDWMNYYLLGVPEGSI